MTEINSNLLFQPDKKDENNVPAANTDNTIWLNYRQAVIKGISELVKIPTLYDGATVTDSMPYGCKVNAGLEWLKETALKDGFEVLEYDGYALAIRIKGEINGKRIDVVSHADVVEPGEGWREEPFGGRITGDFIYGRGTQDMKGPLMLTYYALKYIKDQNIPCKNELRIVIGGDEERTMDDIRYYVEKAGEPDFAFTPDGKFPLSYGEKGALMWVITGEMNTCIKELTGGVQCNVISPMATACLKNLEAEAILRSLLSRSGCAGEVKKEGGLLRITVYGKAAHASSPEDGINATVILLDIITQAVKDPLAELLYNCFQDSWGKGADIYYDLVPMGKLTLNLGVLQIKDNQIYGEIDCRYPYGVTSDILTGKLKFALKPLTAEIKCDDKPTLADITSSYIKVLLNTYRDVTGDEAALPLISGGVTYSKAMKNCVAFGPATEEEISLAHQADERIEIKNLEKLFGIYKEAMLRLALEPFMD